MEFGAEIDGSEDFFQVNKHLLLSGIYQDKTITISIDIVSHATGGVFARPLCGGNASQKDNKTKYIHSVHSHADRRKEANYPCELESSAFFNKLKYLKN